ncbi:MAG TPA: DUF6438 domain-containing protein [Solimonas sp.]|nr:DUF6438 domain-containing protein [Solimonas sp.]
MKPHHSIALGALLLAACAGEPVAPPAAPAAPQPVSGWSFRLHRAGCPLACPDYEIAIAPDGMVDYNGHERVARTGRLRTNADPIRLYELQQQLGRSRFFELAQDYRQGTPDCGLWTPDQPIATLEVSDGARSVRIVHDLGCASAPAQLREIENQIDRATGSARFVRGQ